MPALAEAGYHVIAPNQRGYGRTTGWDAKYDGDLNSFRLLNLVRDAVGLVSAFGYAHVDAVVGHEDGGTCDGLLKRENWRADRRGHGVQVQESLFTGDGLSVNPLKVFGEMSLLTASGLEWSIALRGLLPNFHPQIR